MITATIPGRERFLVECEASVAAQTFRGFEHLVLLDGDGAGCAATYNRLAGEARGEWLFVLADDDLMLPGCLRQHLDHCPAADIVYAPPLVWGWPGPLDHFMQEPPFIPAPVLIRAELWERLGGYDQDWHREEDRRLYQRAVAAGARFVRAETEPTWIYRFHQDNKSLRLAA